MVVDSYDVFLRSEKVAEALRSEVILRFGASPRSKPLLSYLESNQQARQILVQEDDWQDPSHVATDMLHTNPTQFALELTEIAENSADTNWVNRWLGVAKAARAAIREELGRMEEIFEGKIFAELAALLPAKFTLFVGNSMPVRDLDTFYPSTTQAVRFLCNRGGSGIDGVLSTSLGAAAVSSDPTIAVLGDLSFYHDMNGLLAAKKYNLNITIILVNNNGGGVFSFLPQHQYQETFETYFGTPHGLTFKAAASLYGLQYSKASSWPEYQEVVSRSLSSLGTNIVELFTDRERNVELHRAVWSSVAKATEPLIQ